MRSWRRPVVNALALLWATVTSTLSLPARAQEAAPPETPAVEAPAEASDTSEGIDDPKVARRLGTRVALPPASPSVPPEPVAAAPPMPAGTVAAPPVAPPPAGEVAPVAPPPPAGEVEAAAPEGEAATRTPRLKLAYRRFTFAQVGAPGHVSPAADEPFDVVSIDLYPISSTWRFGLTGQYGWHEGTFRQDGDAFFAAATSLGWQIPGPVFTPFLEGYAGGGLMQRTKSDLGLNSIATVFGELGVDVGSEVFLARHLCLSFAVGYVHLTNGFARKTFESFSIDTWSFKVGVGF